MRCTVYVMRQAGVKLPREIVAEHAAEGWLYLGQDSRKFYPRSVARLFRTADVLIDVIEPLLHAHVKKIEGGGLLIFGQEEPAGYGVPNLPQVWWCRPAGRPPQ